MIEELFPDLFRIRVALPGNPLKELNAYLIRGERNLLIDNGFNMDACREVVEGALDGLLIDRERTDFFLSHLHADHCGLTPDLAHAESRIFAGAVDARYINDMTRGAAFWRPFLQEMLRHGISPRFLDQLNSSHPAIRYAPSRPMRFTLVEENDVLRYGRYTLRVLEVPGHTPGQLCLYEEAHKLLFSADHILGDITPNIAWWPGVPDSLGSYLRSLDKVEVLDVALTLPGHRSLIQNMRARVAALRAHHRERLDEVRALLDGRRLNACELAARMTWSVRGKDWDDFPAPQKWFAAGEALAHLDHLRALREVACMTRADGCAVFGLAACEQTVTL